MSQTVEKENKGYSGRHDESYILRVQFNIAISDEGSSFGSPAKI